MPNTDGADQKKSGTQQPPVKNLTPTGSGGKTTKITLPARDPRRKSG
jgi:hypothetical protein